MTNDVTHLRAHLEQSSDADLLRETIGFTAQRLTELEVQSHTGGRPAGAARDPAGPAGHRRAAAHRLRAGRRGGDQRRVAPGRRPAAAQAARAGGGHGLG